jgi:hypothetical protein
MYPVIVWQFTPFGGTFHLGAVSKDRAPDNAPVG